MLGAAPGCRVFRPEGPGVPAYTSPAPPLRFGPSAASPQNSQVLLHPTEIVAPVGTEVVMIAGVTEGGFSLPNQRLEWTLAEGSVGQFVSFQQRGAFDRLLNPFNTPRRVSPAFIIGVTAAEDSLETRRTPDPQDDFRNLRGQTWVTLTSLQEGESTVVVVAPWSQNPAARQQTGTVHWVDGQWVFPPPAINPLGSPHTFTTLVSRQTSGAPIAGWIVRYEITSGPPAGFAPDGAPAVEVATNELGQAAAQLVQSQPAEGTNQIQIQIIRPTPSGKRLVLGQGSTQKTWTSDVSIQVTGPDKVPAGGTATYQIEVTNPSDQPARDLTVTTELPSGLTLIASQPQAAADGARLTWSLDSVPPKASRRMEVTARADRPGSLQFCAELRSASGASARHCSLTTVTAPQLDVVITGPPRADVGTQVTFHITVTNRGTEEARNLLIIDRFDEGLEHTVARSPIERDLGHLAPGAFTSLAVTFKVTKPGRWCNRVEVRGEDGASATAEACLVAGDAEPQRQALAITVTPRTSTVEPGQSASFVIRVANLTARELAPLRLTARLDKPLKATNASEGFRLVEDRQAGEDELIWELDPLGAGRARQFEIVCRCESPADRACCRVKLSGQAGLSLSAEGCLEIQAAEGLAATLLDLDDPLTAGGEVRYLLRVTNRGRTADAQIIVEAIAPPEMSIVRNATRGPTRFEIDGQKVVFSPFPELKPGETATYEIRAQAKAAGTVRFQALIRSSRTRTPILVEQATTILAP